MKDIHSVVRKKKRQAWESLQKRQFRRAKALYAQVCKIAPGDGDSWLNLARVNGELGDYREAAACCRRVLQLDPRLGEAHYVLGKSLKAGGDLQQAIAHFEQALALGAGGAEVYNDLGNALQEVGRLEQAASCYGQALALRPDYVRALFNLGHVRRMLAQPDEAMVCYRKALRLEPADVQIRCTLGVLFAEEGRLEEALQCFREVLERDPAHEDAVAGIADVYEKRGEPAAAYELLRPCLSGTRNSGIAAVYAHLAPALGHYREAVSLIEELLRDGGAALGAAQASRLHFRLGRLYEAMERYDDAFSCYRKGNELRGALFDPDPYVAAIDRMIDGYGGEALAGAARASVRSPRPVFIVGMPRSGTSLVEQTLASHPRIHGGGERYEMKKLISRLPLLPGGQVPDPERVAALTVPELDALALPYLDSLQALAPEAARITDKMPYNFLHLGPISLLFPQARIIHCVRDPLDTCLSCYFQDFAHGNAHTFDLGHLSLYYRQYRRLMDHWKRVIDLPLMEVRYEDMVADHEAVSRALLDFCDLPWDPSCLRFHESPRLVNTASYQQVRQPIYGGSVRRWRRYEAHIGSLIAGLD